MSNILDMLEITRYSRARGAYSLSVVVSGVAAQAAGSTLFSMRWAVTDHLAVIDYVVVSAIVTAAITTGVNFDLETIIARTFTASDTGGTAVVLTSPNQLRRSGVMQGSLVTDMRFGTTIVAGTRTPDPLAIGRIQGFTGTVVGTQVFSAAGQASLLFVPITDRQFPEVLSNNEGLLIRNPLIGPATGTLSIVINIGWTEIRNEVNVGGV